MISAKLRGLQALAPLTLDGSILRCLSQSSWQPPAESVTDQATTEKAQISSSKCISFKVPNGRSFPVNGPKLQLTVWSNKISGFGHPISTASKSVQTERVTEKNHNLAVVSEKLADAFHRLNTWECNRFSKQSNNPSPRKCPAIWFALGELNYSPALFNLGVWYELRAAACSDSDSAVKMKYQSKAEERYKQAVLTDNHPIAAYNLACLLLRTDRREVQVGDHKESVTHLMQIAADSGVESARNFLQK